MAFKFTTAVKNEVLVTAPLKDALNGGFLKVYSGTIPADADAGLGSAVLLVTYSDNAGSGGLNLAATATNGQLVKDPTQTWKGTALVGGSGDASFFRWYKADGITVVLQGTVGTSGAFDMTVADVSLTPSVSYILDFFTVTFVSF